MLAEERVNVSSYLKFMFGDLGTKSGLLLFWVSKGALSLPLGDALILNLPDESCADDPLDDSFLVPRILKSSSSVSETTSRLLPYL